MLVRIRKSARAIVQDQAGRVLLLRFSFPWMKDNVDEQRNSFWVTPGGGLNNGETFEAALRRELVEELGIQVSENLRCIWVRDVTFTDDEGPFVSHERYFHLQLAVDPCVERMSDIEKQTYEGFRWWSVGEMMADRDSLRPIELPELVRDLGQLASLQYPIYIL